MNSVVQSPYHLMAKHWPWVLDTTEFGLGQLPFTALIRAIGLKLEMPLMGPHLKGLDHLSHCPGMERQPQ